MIGAGIMKKIEFPTIIGFIIIGMIAGPYGLGIADAVFVFQKLSHSHIMASLLKEDEDSPK